MESCPEIVRTAVDYAFEALGRQVLYLCCYERNVDDLENIAVKLGDARQRLQHSVDTARQNGERIYEDVLRWMEKEKGISEDIQKFREDGNHARAEFSNCRFPHLWSRYQLSRRGKKLSQLVIVEIQVADSFGSGHISYRMPPKYWAGTSSVQPSGSRITLMDEIIESLKNSNLNMVGVFGLGGVGKTTLVTQVAKRVAEDKLFDVVISAVVRQKMEVREIQKQLAYLLGLDLGKETEGIISASRLRDRLKLEKSVLIVLDDLWEVLHLEKVGIPCGDEHKGCKILLTSRSVEVLSNQMDCQKTFFVDCLPEDEAWSLFKNVAELDGYNVEREILTIATEVAKKCGGLPIAIVTVAKALRKKRVAHWRDALRQLKSPTSRDIAKMVDSCIEFSYRHLGNHELQSLFLLCAWFGRQIEFTDILKYSVGLGLLSYTSTIAESRDRLETLLTTLKASCLLTLGSDSTDCFTMHDVVRDVGISIAAKCQNQLTVRFDKLNVWPDQNELQSCTAINLMKSEILCELPNELFCPALIFLLICNKEDHALKIPANFFKRVCKLKVLDFTQVQFSCLPPSMADLTNLESLSLDGCILQDIEVIGELKKLKILSLAYSKIRRLPQSFENLTQLQLLDLSDCCHLERISRNVISKWKNLEELMMEHTNVQWENEGSNACLTELNHLPMLKTLEICIDSSMLTRGLELENLTRYRISIGRMWELQRKSNISRMLTIMLESWSDLYLERWIKILLKSVQELHLDEIGVKSVVNELNEDGFPYLKHVEIRNSVEIQYLVNLKERLHPFDVFPDLEFLFLFNLLSLEKICDGKLSQASFSKLKVINVWGCHALRNLFSMYTGIGLISRLEEIKVVSCDSMTQIFGGDKMEDNNVDFGVLEFNQLKSLTLEELHTLVGFVGFSTDVKDGFSMRLFSEKVAFLKLETLILVSIHFKYLFSLSGLKCLVKLKRLEIRSCRLMEDIIHLEDWRNISDSGEILFPSLTTMWLCGLDSLRSIWSEHVPPIAYPKLKGIEIESCHKLKTIIPTYMLGRLKSLEALIVRSCSSLDEVFSMNADGNIERMEMTNLKELRLIHLPKLKHIWSEYPKGNSCFQSLQMIKVSKCHSLENIFPLSMAKSLAKLQEMHIWANGALKEIVSKDESVKEAAQFVFPEMTKMRMTNMPELNWFYEEIHTLEFPKLKNLNISKCYNLELFVMQMLGPSELEKTNVVNQKELGIQKPLFFIEKDLPALETLSLDGEQFEKIQNMAKFSMNHFRMLKELLLDNFYREPAFFPYFLLQRIPTLEKLNVSYSSFGEVFPRANLHSQTKDDRTICHIKVLHLSYLPKLEYICEEGFQLDQTLDKLEELDVQDCSSLTELLPSNISVNHLAVIKIEGCDMLYSLSSISTFKSLVQLKTLEIKDCKMMVEIIRNDRQDGGEGEVEFCQLRSLHLRNLPRLEHFSSTDFAFNFPNLEVAIVKNCPSLKIFSKKDSKTPKLEKVQNICLYWEGNLNATISEMFKDNDF